MRIIEAADTAFSGKTALCLGNFDGFHRAHRTLLLRAADFARAQKLNFAVFTFSPPIPNEFPLSTQEEKFDFFRDLGVEVLFCAPFERLRALPPEVFIRDYLLRRFCASAVFCGYDYTFGRDRAGNVDTLNAALQPYGVVLNVLEKQTIDGIAISSSEIRRLIRDREYERAELFFGHPIPKSVQERL